MPLAVGQQAPDFQAKAGMGTEKIGDLVKLSDLYRDKNVVLAFFVFAFTGNEKAG